MNKNDQVVRYLFNSKMIMYEMKRSKNNQTKIDFLKTKNDIQIKQFQQILKNIK